MVPERLQWLVAPGSPATVLGERFAEAGFALYLVGGSLRDALLGRPAEDLDFATDARPTDIKTVIEPVADAIYSVGERFGTIAMMLDGQTYEITTFRNEIYRDDSRQPEVSFSDDIETDLSRRDFTINAMALRLPDAELVDPFGGLADLAMKRIRTPLSPEISFSDDPLRMMRLYRFAAVLNFELDPLATEAVVDMADRIEIISKERIREELTKLLVSDHPARGLRGIVDSGLAEYFLPELNELKAQQDPLHRHKDVWEHTLAVVEKTRPEARIRLAALLHDVGKPATRKFEKGGVTFHHHEVVGARMASRIMSDLRFPKDLTDEVRQLVFLHLRPHTFKMGWTDSAVRRYARDAGPLLQDLNELVRCDVTTGNARRANAIQRRIDELEERIGVLSEEEELGRLRPPVDGNQVMAHLGLSPGPQLGGIMKMLLEHRIDHGPYSEEEALTLAKDWALERGLIDA